MPKHINIIARSNGVGLDRDVSLLSQALQQAGHQVSFSHCRSRSLFQKWTQRKPKFDVNIFLERVFPVWNGSAKLNVLIPNQERFPKRHLSRLKKIDHILCKSQHALEVFQNHIDNTKTSYIGFTSESIELDASIEPDYNSFFHLAGKSTLKGTESILKLWEKHPEWPTLTVLQHQDNAPESVPDNVKLIADYLPQEELIQLANKIGIHLCPSRSEGWGHYIVEAMSCHSVVITTDAPPMNELVTTERGILVPYQKQEPRHLGTNYFVDETALEKEIIKTIHLSTEQKQNLAKRAQQWFQQNHQQFIHNVESTFSRIL